VSVVWSDRAAAAERVALSALTVSAAVVAGDTLRCAAGCAQVEVELAEWRSR
jgi:hypothetical protein